ncbi:hypothetical protein JCM13580A_56900 [Streptomyces drozdowiczii]
MVSRSRWPSAPRRCADQPVAGATTEAATDAARPTACALQRPAQHSHRHPVSLALLAHHRRLARDYEAHPRRSEAMINIAMIDLMSRRLTREPTHSWRDN